MNILITGGSGFLGRKLALELSKNLKNKIHIFDIKELKIKEKIFFFHKCNLNKPLFIKNKKKILIIYFIWLLNLVLKM